MVELEMHLCYNGRAYFYTYHWQLYLHAENALRYFSLILSILLAIAVMVPVLAAGSDNIILILASDASESVRFGTRELENALSPAGMHTERSSIKSLPAQEAKIIACNAGTFTQVESSLKELRVTVPEKAESFAIARRDDDIFVVGRDSTGTMYGLLELAERIKLDGLDALKVEKPIVQSPYLEFRAVNPFLTLPMPGDRDWWFHSEEFWSGYLDMLARDRINWLDLHGMYNIITTRFINMLPYFTKSEKFHDVGVSPEEAKRNMIMLQKVIRMAHDRGIKVAVMNYYAAWSIPEKPNPSHPQTEAYLAEYTRETVAQFLRQAPDLDMFGFRIGESGMGADFYRKSYLQGIADSGTHPELFTRSWGATKEKVADIVDQNGGPIYLEIKYNGEQYGQPYQVAGGRISGWRDYSYQDFLSYPRPYRVVWQVRVNGTHRTFRWGNPEWVARTVRSATLGDAAGISVEPLNTYYPMTDFLHKHGIKHDTIHWGYERDWFYYQLWGRLAYDPNLGERIWLAEFENRFGKDIGGHLYRAMAESSKIVDLGYTFHALGPDHRQHAPDLETGGDLRAWVKGEPFDTQVAQSVQEYVSNIVEGRVSGKAGPLDGAKMIHDAADASLWELDGLPELTGEVKCIALDVRALAALGNYYSSKLRAATELALLEATGDEQHGEAAGEYASKAYMAWHELSEITNSHYKPFVENLRMNTRFHWKNQERLLVKDFEIIRKAMGKAKPAQSERLAENSGPKPQVVASDVKLITMDSEHKRLIVQAQLKGADSVVLWHKSLPSESRWTATQMKPDATGYTASIDVGPTGAMYYLEAKSSSGAILFPDFRKETPYRAVEPWDSRVLAAELGEDGNRPG